MTYLQVWGTGDAEENVFLEKNMPIVYLCVYKHSISRTNWDKCLKSAMYLGWNNGRKATEYY